MASSDIHRRHASAQPDKTSPTDGFQPIPESPSTATANDAATAAATAANAKSPVGQNVAGKWVWNSLGLYIAAFYAYWALVEAYVLDVINLYFPPGKVSMEMLETIPYPPDVVRRLWFWWGGTDTLLWGNLAYMWWFCFQTVCFVAPLCGITIYYHWKRDCKMQISAFFSHGMVLNTLLPIFCVYTLDPAYQLSGFGYFIYISYTLIVLAGTYELIRQSVRANELPGTSLGKRKADWSFVLYFCYLLPVLVTVPFIHILHPIGTITRDSLNQLQYPPKAIRDYWFLWATHVEPMLLENEIWSASLNWSAPVNAVVVCAILYGFGKNCKWLPAVAMLWAGWMFAHCGTILCSSHWHGVKHKFYALIYVFPMVLSCMLVLRMKAKLFENNDGVVIKPRPRTHASRITRTRSSSSTSNEGLDRPQSSASIGSSISRTSSMSDYSMMSSRTATPVIPFAIGEDRSCRLMAPGKEIKWLLDNFGFVFSPKEPTLFHRIVQKIFVVPMTNVAATSLSYQLYLYEIFHQTFLNRLSHFVCMPIIIFFAECILSPYSVIREDPDEVLVFDVNAAFFMTVVLLTYWTYWGMKTNTALLGVFMVPPMVAMHMAACVYMGLFRTSTDYRAEHSFLHNLFFPTIQIIANPWVYFFLFSVMQSFGHAFDKQIPPRANNVDQWLTYDVFYAQAPSKVLVILEMIAQGLIFGTIAEMLASFRYLPIQTLKLAHMLGYPSRRVDKMLKVSQLVIQFGNPALDFIGIGGGATYGSTKSASALRKMMGETPPTGEEQERLLSELDESIVKISEEFNQEEMDELAREDRDLFDEIQQPKALIAHVATWRKEMEDKINGAAASTGPSSHAHRFSEPSAAGWSGGVASAGGLGVPRTAGLCTANGVDDYRPHGLSPRAQQTEKRNISRWQHGSNGFENSPAASNDGVNGDADPDGNDDSLSAELASPAAKKAN